MQCMYCGKPAAQSPLRLKSGRPKYLKRCEACYRAHKASRVNGARQFKLTHKKPHCEACGFLAKHPAQLDVDHIDGNRLNNDPSNFQTLCANCHRLKTIQSKDHNGYARVMSAAISPCTSRAQPMVRPGTGSRMHDMSNSLDHGIAQSNHMLSAENKDC